MLNRVFELSSKSDTDLQFVFLKLVEEVGELSKALNQPHRCDEPAESECADVVIAVMDLFCKLCKVQEIENPEQVFSTLLNKKLDKWETYL